MSYLLDRLKEPGTMRSLAVVLFAIRLWLPGSIAEQLVDVNAAQAFIEGLIGLLGLWSALMPEKGMKAVEAVQQAAATVHEASGMAVSAAQEAKATTSRAAGIVQQAVGRKL